MNFRCPSAAKLYVQKRSIDAFVGWAPYIYIAKDQEKLAEEVWTRKF